MQLKNLFILLFLFNILCATQAATDSLQIINRFNRLEDRLTEPNSARELKREVLSALALRNPYLHARSSLLVSKYYFARRDWPNYLRFWELAWIVYPARNAHPLGPALLRKHADFLAETGLLDSSIRVYYQSIREANRWQRSEEHTSELQSRFG